MKTIARDVLGRARVLESRIARTVEGVARRLARSGGRQPLEVAHAVADAVEAQVQPSGRGHHVFPFNVIVVSVVAATREARARYAGVFEGQPTLRDRIVGRLEAAGCDALDVTVTVTYATRAKPEWMAPDLHVTFDRIAAAPTPAVARSPVALDLTVVQGVAERVSYTFTQQRIDLGRCAEVQDQRHRLIRTNHVAFLDDADAINQSVSRQHAHVEAAQSGAYRLVDDRSAQGTIVLRQGKTVPVPPGARGVRLQSGDEIGLGRARLRVALSAVKPSSAEPVVLAKLRLKPPRTEAPLR